MAITTYAELQTAVENWTHRSDLASRIPEFIALAEQRMFYGADPVRVSAMQTRATGTTSGSVLALPTGYLETIRLVSTYGGVNYNLEYLDPNTFTQYEALSGQARFYTLLGGELKIAPATDGSYIHDYYAKLTALSDSNTTNWLLTNAPSVYLFGTVIEVATYIRDAEMLNGAADLYTRAKEGLNASEKKKFESSAMTVRAA